MAPPPLPGATYKGAAVTLPPPVTPPPTVTPSVVSPRNEKSAATPPTEESPALSEVEPPDVAEVAADGGDEGVVGDGGNDDDGWGEFESA